MTAEMPVVGSFAEHGLANEPATAGRTRRSSCS
jgi:hypothetical protein